jgi:hypothetical protein
LLAAIPLSKHLCQQGLLLDIATASLNGSKESSRQRKKEPSETAALKLDMPDKGCRASASSTTAVN